MQALTVSPPTSPAKAIAKHSKKLLSADSFSEYDYILIDCSPAADLLVTNAIAAADKLLIPVQCDIMSYNKVNDILQQLVNTKMILMYRSIYLVS